MCLDGGGAFVQGVDLGVPDVLLDRIVLQEAGSTQGLQAFSELGVSLFGAHTLDYRQHQVVDLDGQLGVHTVHHLGDSRVLESGGVEVERTQALGVSLLGHQRAAHVGVMCDRHPGRGLVGHLGQVGTLHAGLGVLKRVEVAGGQRRDGLRADHHAGLLNDLEHLRDAVVYLADQPALGGDAVLAERQFTGRRDL
ncbi:Uncharacterised protein [Mycobacterium tuberculosis]|nr:Uncharacterised protein [Mycobacterium tuberculosis]